jgi:hypothetical protein
MVPVMKKILSGIALAVSLSPLLAGAETGPAAAPPALAAPALRYDSAFSDYKPWQDLGPGDWKAANAAVAGAGHAAAQSPPASAPMVREGGPVKRKSAPTVDPQGGHHMHGGQQ